MLAGVVASAVLATSCSATPVQYGVNRDARVETAPWIAAGPGPHRLVGFLYPYSEILGDARVRTGPGFV